MPVFSINSSILESIPCPYGEFDVDDSVDSSLLHPVAKNTNATANKTVNNLFFFIMFFLFKIRSFGGQN